jgi:hypothetical protein
MCGEYNAAPDAKTGINEAHNCEDTADGQFYYIQISKGFLPVYLALRLCPIIRPPRAAECGSKEVSP